MKQWEYIVVGDLSPGNWDRLNTMGINGWEACGVMQQLGFSGETLSNHVLMKRELNPSQSPMRAKF